MEEKKVTFSCGLHDTRVTETFTFEQMRITDDMDDLEIEKYVDRIFKEWVWSQISFSLIIDG
ncbi:hypothetical protein G4V62_05530 [Bacillaceae bacterium SIJ1]|uniref:hypothetical protein n=1 Tax=Litoribacterium kuwaitense TaxID=1398745 RepID=UPI0013EC2D6D|nr:hypothetical protein [Litoribacterium kuwaitense]NGP44442.1 hypothetical protein [Litoribacterium kuwaitense]